MRFLQLDNEWSVYILIMQSSWSFDPFETVIFPDSQDVQLNWPSAAWKEFLGHNSQELLLKL